MTSDRTTPTHAPIPQFPVENGELLVGGIPLTRLAARVGQTPFYAYDRQLLNQRVAALRSTLPPTVKLHYAMKANPMPALVAQMASLVDGMRVAQIPYVALGTLDVGLADTDANTGLMRVAVTVNAKLLDISQTIIQEFFTMTMLVDAEKADIPFADLAVALLDETEQPQHLRQRFTLAY